MRTIMNARFCVYFVEIIIVNMIFFTKFQNIASSSQMGTTFEKMVQYVNVFVAISVAMIAVQILLTLFGTPLNKNVVPFQLTWQIVGLFAFGCFILMRLHYQTISFIWGIFCLIPFLMDIYSVISQYYSNRKYQLLNSQ